MAKEVTLLVPESKEELLTTGVQKYQQTLDVMNDLLKSVNESLQFFYSLCIMGKQYKLKIRGIEVCFEKTKKRVVYLNPKTMQHFLGEPLEERLESLVYISEVWNLFQNPETIQDIHLAMRDQDPFYKPTKIYTDKPNLDA